MSKFKAVYAGDNGADYGLFDGGVHASIEEAIEAVREGLKSCYCHSSFGWVADDGGRIILVLDGSGEIVEIVGDESSHQNTKRLSG